MSDHTYINLLPASVTVPDPAGRSITVLSWYDRERFKAAPGNLFVVKGEHYAQFVGPRGPLFPTGVHAPLAEKAPASSVRDDRGVDTARAENTSWTAAEAGQPPLAPAAGSAPAAAPAVPAPAAAEATHGEDGTDPSEIEAANAALAGASPVVEGEGQSATASEEPPVVATPKPKQGKSPLSALRK